MNATKNDPNFYQFFSADCNPPVGGYPHLCLDVCYTPQEAADPTRSGEIRRRARAELVAFAKKSNTVIIGAIRESKLVQRGANRN